MGRRIETGAQLAGWRVEKSGWTHHSNLAAPCERCGGSGVEGALTEAFQPWGSTKQLYWCCTPCRQELARTVPVGLARSPVWDRP